MSRLVVARKKVVLGGHAPCDSNFLFFFPSFFLFPPNPMTLRMFAHHKRIFPEKRLCPAHGFIVVIPEIRGQDQNYAHYRISGRSELLSALYMLIIRVVQPPVEEHRSEIQNKR